LNGKREKHVSKESKPGLEMENIDGDQAKCKRNQVELASLLFKLKPIRKKSGNKK
jgi:hypothetical protein